MNHLLHPGPGLVNLAIVNRSRLVNRHYLQKANPKIDYWGAFFYRRLYGKYIQAYGNDFYLIIVGAVDGERDFYVIPYKVMRHLLTENNLRNGLDFSQMRWIWNILPGHQFSVWNSGEVDVRRFYGSRGLLQDALFACETVGQSITRVEPQS